MFVFLQKMEGLGFQHLVVALARAVIKLQTIVLTFIDRKMMMMMMMLMQWWQQEGGFPLTGNNYFSGNQRQLQIQMFITKMSNSNSANLILLHRYQPNLI